MKISAKFDRGDFWTGILWRSKLCRVPRSGPNGAHLEHDIRRAWDLWICIVPFVPIHVWWYGGPEMAYLHEKPGRFEWAPADDIDRERER